MRNRIKQILREEIQNKPMVGTGVYLIMNKDGNSVFTKYLTRGTYWVDISDYDKGEYQSYYDLTFKTESEAKDFLKLVIHCFEERGKICGYKLEKQEQRENFNPEDWEVVEYVLGLVPKTDLF